MAIGTDQSTFVKLGLDRLPALLRADVEVLLPGVSMMEVKSRGTLVVAAYLALAPQVCEGSFLEV